MSTPSVEPTKSATSHLPSSTSDVKKESQTLPKKGPQNSLLEPFLGRWRMAGTFGESDATDGKNKATGDESYEWIPGEFFLQYRWDRDFAGKEHIGTGIFGYDEEKQKYFAHFFDNLGYARIYEVEIRKNSFSLFGKSERAIISVNPRALCNLKAELIGNKRSTKIPM